jgi:hypothetical protein
MKKYFYFVILSVAKNLVLTREILRVAQDDSGMVAHD